MKARVFTSQQRRIMAQVIQEEAAKATESGIIRAQGLWMIAMLNAGLSVRTINRVIKELDPVVEKYSTAVDDGVGDYALYAELRAKGIRIKPIEGMDI